MVGGVAGYALRPSLAIFNKRRFTGMPVVVNEVLDKDQTLKDRAPAHSSNGAAGKASGRSTGIGVAHCRLRVHQSNPNAAQIAARDFQAFLQDSLT